MTDLKVEVTNAIVAHSQWKMRLKQAIDKGSSEFKPEVLQQDNQCAFGLWFYTLPLARRSSVQANQIKELHASFHKEAAHILRLALQGHKVDAENAMALKSTYSKISSQLVQQLAIWKDS